MVLLSLWLHAIQPQSKRSCPGMKAAVLPGKSLVQRRDTVGSKQPVTPANHFELPVKPMLCVFRPLHHRAAGHENWEGMKTSPRVSHAAALIHFIYFLSSLVETTRDVFPEQILSNDVRAKQIVILFMCYYDEKNIYVKGITSSQSW